jgi:biotin carboxyl carrier protein
MRIKCVRNLIRIVEESNISKLEVSALFGVNKILIKKRDYSAPRDKPDYIAVEYAFPVPTVENKVKEEKIVKKEIGMVYINAPNVGIFYWNEDLENSDTKFKSGSRIKKDQILAYVVDSGIIYPLSSPCDGVVEYILDKPQGHSVQLDENLFKIKPNT